MSDCAVRLQTKWDVIVYNEGKLHFQSKVTAKWVYEMCCRAKYITPSYIFRNAVGRIKGMAFSRLKLWGKQHYIIPIRDDKS